MLRFMRIAAKPSVLSANASSAARIAAESFAQHARHVIVGQAVAGLDHHRGLDTRGQFARRRRQQAVCVDLKRDPDARSASGHRRDAAQLEARERAAVGHQFTLALHHMDGHGRLAILEGGELLRLGHRNGGIALDDAFDQAAHGFDAQRQRDHVEQQQLALARIAGQSVGLDGGTQSHHLVRVEVGQRRPPRIGRHRTPHRRHARRTAHQHDALHFAEVDPGITHDLAQYADRAFDQRPGRGVKRFAVDRHIERAAGQLDADTRPLLRGQRLFGRTRRGQNGLLVARRVGYPSCLRQRPCRERTIEVVAAECRVAAGGDHLEHAACEAQQRHVEGAAAEVVDQVQALAAVVQPVGQRGGGRLVDEPHDSQPSQLGGILGGLALRTIEVRGYRDHCAKKITVERILGPLPQDGQNLRRYLDR